jgi:SagB-type dehydrogenase family enzyme
MLSSSFTASHLRYRLARGAGLADSTGSVLTFKEPGGALIPVDAQFPSVVKSLVLLSQGGGNLPQLTSLAAAGGGEQAVRRLHHCLEDVTQHNCCELAWEVNGQERAVVRGMCRGFTLSHQQLELDRAIILSRFAYVRRDGDTAAIESPEALCRVEFTCPQTWLWLGVLARPTSIAMAVGDGQRFIADLINLLWGTRFLELAHVAEPEDRAIWEFHDLLFHWRSRGGRVSGPQGGTYRHLHRAAAPPAIKPRMSENTIILAKPREGNPLHEGNLESVMERRRSVREQDARPISVEQLGRLLYHVARVQRRVPGEYQELLSRPIPAAGAIHELEFYLLVGRCDGLGRGMYHYHCELHTLHRLATQEHEIESLLAEAAYSWGKPEDAPQVLIILASRLPRLAWKYEGIAYRLTLLNAGAAIQSLYLLASEMGLACSAIGGGDSGLFAIATDLDPLMETSVAEFAVGSRRR